MIPFGEHFDQSYYDMLGRAFLNAKNHVDAGVSNDEIEAAWLGTAYGTLSHGAEIVSGARLSEATGLWGIPISRNENACATGSDAVRNAVHAVQAGKYDVVVVAGAEKMRDKDTDEFMKTVTNRPTSRGMTAPAFFAMYAQRHMHEFGTSREQMAEVAVKNHANGTKCEYSHFDFTIQRRMFLKRRTFPTHSVSTTVRHRPMVRHASLSPAWMPLPATLTLLFGYGEWAPASFPTL